MFYHLRCNAFHDHLPDALRNLCGGVLNAFTATYSIACGAAVSICCQALLAGGLSLVLIAGFPTQAREEDQCNTLR